MTDETANVVQEAWAEFVVHLRNALDDARRGPHGSQPWPEDRARALALAVLDAAENSGCLYPGCDHPCTSCPLEALRTKLEALGR